MNPAAHSPSELLPEPLPTGPMELVSAWLAAAWERAQQPNPNAMTLATSTAEGRPAARIVLCKAIVPEPGYVVFYTNYRSRKGRELEGNPRAAAVMHWDRLRRQVRIEGPVERSPAAESDAYFASRPLPSQIGAWASEQSAPVGSRAELQAAVAAAARRFGVVPEDGNLDESEGMDPASRNAAERPGAAAAGNVPRPPHWGGYRLWAEAVELWTEGAARIHDRARWTRRLTRSGGRMTAGPWSVTRLQP